MYRNGESGRLLDGGDRATSPWGTGFPVAVRGSGDEGLTGGYAAEHAEKLGAVAELKMTRGGESEDE